MGLRKFFKSQPKRIFSQVRCSIVQGKHNTRSQYHCSKLATLAPDEVTGPVRSLATSYFCGAPGTGVYVLSKVNETSWYGLRCTEETLNMHVKSSAPTLKAKKKTMMRTKRKHFHNGSMWSSGELTRWNSVHRGRKRTSSAANQEDCPQLQGVHSFHVLCTFQSQRRGRRSSCRWVEAY